MSLHGRLLVAEEVSDALASSAPIVALESTLISHGLPYPQNVEVARAAEAAVREAGAVPATVAIRGGRFLVGLEDADIEALARTSGVLKATRPTLGQAFAAGGWAATTVSATLIAAHAAGIQVFATGGIGGVHHGALGGPNPTFDISADLEELARTPVAVVCAGPKAILDVPATLEYLETRGVPVVAIGMTEVPGFFARTSGVAAPATAIDLQAAADLVATHLALGLGSGILVCTPVPEAAALPETVARDAVNRALREAAAAGVRGPTTTPWLLARVAEITGGASVRANTALIVNDARQAAGLAVALRSGASGG